MRINGVTFDASQFVSAHGKRPSGQGSWAFINAHLAHRNDYLDFVYWVNNARYSDAKKMAAQHFSAKGVFAVVVLS